MVIKPYSDINKPGIEFGLTYYDNPGISIPDAITSWVAMKAMPEFLKRLRQAAKEYKKYLQESGQLTVQDVSIEKRNTDDSVLETSFQRNITPVIRLQREEKIEERRETNVEVMISPTVIVPENESSSYWKYLRPTYYFG